MPRDSRLYLADIVQASSDVAEFVGGMSFDEFKSDKKTVHAVVRNLEVIGEAAKAIPAEIRQQHGSTPWQRIAGLRDVLIHHYFGIDVEIVWDIVTNKLPDLERQVRAILDRLPEPPQAD
jgi:uncharacterized protein with HEPN domain